MFDIFRTGTILSAKHIMLRTFVLMAYFFVPSHLTHKQLIHEVDLGVVGCLFFLVTLLQHLWVVLFVTKLNWADVCTPIVCFLNKSTTNNLGIMFERLESHGRYIREYILAYISGGIQQVYCLLKNISGLLFKCSKKNRTDFHFLFDINLNSWVLHFFDTILTFNCSNIFQFFQKILFQWCATKFVIFSDHFTPQWIVWSSIVGS